MKKLIFWLCGVVFFAVTAGAAQAQKCRDPATLRLAVIPQMKNQLEQGRYDVLVNVLQADLVRDVVLVTAGSYSAVIEGLLDGSVDLAELGAGSYVTAKERGAAITAFASLHSQMDAEGPESYHSVLVTRQDAGIRSLEALRGSALSLVDPVSTSGGIVPRAAVPRLTGLPLESWFGRISFAGSHDLAIEAVLAGRVAAAFVAGSRVEKGIHNGKPLKKVLRVLWRSEPIPFDPFVYQSDLCEPLKQMIQRVFLERQDSLKPFFSWRNKQGFVPVSDDDYQFLLSTPPVVGRP